MSDAETTPPAAPAPAPAQAAAPPNLTIHKIYIKDLSFESPSSPVIFNENWQPQAEINVQNSARKVGETVYEVVLTVTVTARLQDKVGFLVEVQQAGLFEVNVPDEEAVRPLVGGTCPNILYPYAREAVSALIGRGGFPPLLLAPADFDALYRERAAAQSGT